MTNSALNARVFDANGQVIEVGDPETSKFEEGFNSTADLVEELMPYIKRRKRIAYVEQELWERIEAWYGRQGLEPLTDETVTGEGLRHVMFLGTAWVSMDDRKVLGVVVDHG